MNKIELLKLTKELCGEMPMVELLENTKYLEEYLFSENLEQYKDMISSQQNFMKYIKIVDPVNGLEPIELRPKYVELCDLIKDNDRICINTYRQSGLTTFFACHILYEMVSKKNQTILYMAPNNNHLEHFIDIFKIMYENLHIKLRPGIIQYTKRNVTFDNGSKLITRNGSDKNAGRGLSLNELIIDCAAFLPWKIDKEIFSNIMPTMCTGKQKIIIGSTPNQTKGLYYDIWFDLNNGFEKFLIKPYDNMPLEQYEEKMKWYKETGYTSYLREFDNYFVDIEKKAKD